MFWKWVNMLRMGKSVSLFFFFLTCLQLFGLDWNVLSLSSSFLKSFPRELGRKIPVPQNPLRFQVFSHPLRGKTKITYLQKSKQATKIYICLLFRKLSWIWKNTIHVADINQDNTKAQASFSPIGLFSVPRTVVPISTYLSKFCYATFWLRSKVNCQFTDTTCIP